MAHPGGRPTDCTPELIEEARQYLENFEKEGDLIPSIAGLAVKTGKSRSILHKWATDDDKPEYLDIYNRIIAKQERILVSKGLSGDFNATIAKLVLGKHGYSDSQKTEITAPEGVTFNMNFGGSPTNSK